MHRQCQATERRLYVMHGMAITAYKFARRTETVNHNRYKTAPLGYLAAGDAFTHRYYEILLDVENKTECVDDTILWAKNLSDIFYSTCEFLT